MSDDFPSPSPSPSPQMPKLDRRESRSEHFTGEREMTWYSFLAALSFLTIVPSGVRRLFTNQEMGAAVAQFPLVGGLLGLMLMMVQAVASKLFPAEVAAVITVTAWVMVTGGLHLDGFLDCCDGLWGGRTPDERLRIMRDERVGAYAVMGGILLTLMKCAALTRLVHVGPAIIVACVTGRWMISMAITSFEYGRADGLGRVMKDFAPATTQLKASIYGLAAILCAAPWHGGLALIAAWSLGLLVIHWVLGRLPGLTGDVYGALCEIGEVTVLVAFTALERGHV